MESLGQFLREAREAKGYTIDDAHEATKISKKYLRALEEENFAVLPDGHIFIKGFLRSYSDFLGIDSKKAIDLLSNHNKLTTDEEIEKKDDKEEVHSADPEIKARREKRRKRIAENDGNLAEKPSMKFNWLLMVGAIVVLLVASLCLNHFLKSDEEQAVEQLNTPVIENKVETEKQAEKPVEKPIEEKKPVLEAPVVLAAKIDKDCWVEVKVDGKTIVSEVLKAGQEQKWQGDKEIEISVGNAGGISINYNGEDLGPMGNAGQVVKKKFTADGANDKKADQDKENTIDKGENE